MADPVYSVKELFNLCEGITQRIRKSDHAWDRGQSIVEHLLDDKVEDVKVPDNIYVEITKTATKGTIGRLIGLDNLTWYDQDDGSKKLYEFGLKFILEVDGRKQPVRINQSHAKILRTHDGTTKYVRNVKSHDQVKIQNPVNKFMQELQKGDWVIGVTKGNKGLGIGRITRWTNHNVWGTRDIHWMPDQKVDKSMEFQFDSIQQTFTMPNEDHVKLLTMAVLKGWNGR